MAISIRTFVQVSSAAAAKHKHGIACVDPRGRDHSVAQDTFVTVSYSAADLARSDDAQLALIAPNAANSRLLDLVAHYFSSSERRASRGARSRTTS